MIRPATLFTALAITLASCEGMVQPHGHVYDKDNRRPIDSVQAILILDKHDTIWACKPAEPRYTLSFTDRSGYFETSSDIIGTMFGYPEYSVLLLKRGYRFLDVTNTNDSIFLERDRR